MIAKTSFAAAALAAVFGAALLAGPAIAQNETRGAGQWLSLSEIDQRLAARGYRALEIERDDGRYEVKAFDSQGRCRELDINPRTGEIIHEESDDDCRDGDR